MTKTELYQQKLTRYKAQLRKHGPQVDLDEPAPVLSPELKPVAPINLSSPSKKRPSWQQGTLYLSKTKRGGNWYGRYMQTRVDDAGVKTRNEVRIWLGAESIGKMEARRRLRHEIELSEIERNPVMAADQKIDRTGVSRIQSGAASELIACGNLLLLGFEVFRSVSPSASCDLCVIKSGRIYRVEVKTGDLNADGEPVFCDVRSQIGRFDILCIVRPDGTVAYLPASEKVAEELRFVRDRISAVAPNSCRDNPASDSNKTTTDQGDTIQ